MACVLVEAVFAVTVTTVVQATLSVLVWMVKSRVLKVALSPPAPACFTTKLETLNGAPRSTCRKSGAVVEQNLSVLPPETLPLTALAGPSLALQAVLPLAALFRARFAPAGAVLVGVG